MGYLVAVVCAVVLLCGIAESAEKVTEETQRCKITRQMFWCHEQMFDEFVECDGGLEMDSKSDVNWDILERVHHTGTNPYKTNTQIPSDIPADTKLLILRNYQYDILTRRNLSHLKHVQCFIIKDSEINKIEKDAFGDTTELTDLQLQNTRLSDYDQLKFITHPEFMAYILSASGSTVTGGLYFNGTDNLSRIKELRIAGNAINYINPSILNHLKNVEILDLARNQLAQLDWPSLRNHEKLTNFYIDDNKFQAIPEWVVYKIREGGLSNNPWHCNCDMKWLTKAASIPSIIKPEELVCTTPVKKRVADMLEEEFVCGTPRKPTITWGKHGDSKYLIQCASVADPPPKLALALALTGVKIADFPAAYDISQGNTTSPKIEVLPGTYSCVADNSYGISHNIETVPTKQEHDDSSAGNRLSPKLFIFLIAIIACTHL